MLTTGYHSGGGAVALTGGLLVAGAVVAAGIAAVRRR